MNRIYYFSGTGNSLRAAMRFAETLGNTEIVSMKCFPEDYPATECDIVGFVFPVYHWILPEPVSTFVGKLDINPNAYVFAVAMPSIIPGLSLERMKLLLQEKNIALSYGNYVNNVARAIGRNKFMFI